MITERAVLLAIVVASALMYGCAQKRDAVHPAPSQPYHGTRAELPLGTVLGCAQQLTQYGFTKEECGALWGAQIEIEVHDAGK